MGDRLLLDLAHYCVRSIHCGGHQRAIAMFDLDRFGETGIVASQVEFQRAPARGKSKFELIKGAALLAVKFKALMDEPMEVVFHRRYARKQYLADQYSGDSGQECTKDD